MGDFGIGAGYDPDFTEPPLVDDPGLDAGGYDPGADSSAQDPSDPSFDAGVGAILPGEDIIPFDGGGFGGLSPVVLAAARSMRLGPFEYSSNDAPGAVAPIPVRARPGQPTKNPATERVRAIIATISAHIGKHVTLRASIQYIRKWGMPSAATAFGVGADDLMFLTAYQTMKQTSRGRRGPHLHTVVKRIKAGERYRHMLSRWARKAGIHHHRAASAPPMKRRK